MVSIFCDFNLFEVIVFASLCQLLYRPTLTAKNSRRKEAGLAPGSGIDGSASERQRENCRESVRYKTESLANGMGGGSWFFSWIWISFLGFSLVHRRYFNVCWPLGLGAFAHFTWSLTKKNDAELREIWPLKKEDYVMAWCSSLKCQMALNPASTALWLSFFHFLMPIKCYYVSFKPRKPTVYYIYLLRGELISIILLGRSNCVPWFHWNVKMGALEQSIRTLPAMGQHAGFGHMFSLETGPVLQVEMACSSSEYSLKLQWWNDVLIYLISSCANWLSSLETNRMTWPCQDHLAKSKHNCKAWRITSHRYLSCTKTSMVQFQTQPIPCLGSWHRGERGKNRQNFKN